MKFSPVKISDLETPALIIDQTVLEKNIETMERLLQQYNIKLRPHYKSHHCIDIAKLQLERGASGITCSKLGEAADLVSYGIKDILIANQITDEKKIQHLAELALKSHITVCVDSAENILALEKAMSRRNAELFILVEYEVGMNRCGVDSPEEFLHLVQVVSGCSHLHFMEIQAYAGQLSHEVDYSFRLQESIKIENRLAGLIKFLKQHNISVPIVSGCSTGTAVLPTRLKTVYTELQAGSYLFMDSSYNLLNLPFESSLFMVANIISVKENRIVTDAGAKSFAMDQNPPVLLSEFPYNSTCIHEEHTIHTFSKHNYHVNDRVKYIPGHCCTTINMFDHIYLTKGDNIIKRISVTSRGKSF